MSKSLSIRFAVLFSIFCYTLILITSPAQLIDLVEDRNTSAIYSALSFAIPINVFGLIHTLILSQNSRRMTYFNFLLCMFPAVIIVIFTTLIVPDRALISSSILVALATVSLIASKKLVAKNLNPPVWVFIIFTALTYSSILLLILIYPIKFPVALGSISILSLAIGFISIFLFAILAYPKFAVVVLVFLAISFSSNYEHKMTTIVSTNQDYNLYNHFDDWLTSRKDLKEYKKLKRPYPVFVVASEGGGIYAAAHTYSVLTKLQNFCPNFSQHVLAMTGTSGGAVGTSLVAAKWGTGPRLSEVSNCKFSKRKVDFSPIETDFLSPILATFFFLEAMDAILPIRLFQYDRGDALSAAISSASRNSSKIIDQPLNKLWKPNGNLPILAMVSTDITTGNSVALSTASFRNLDAQNAVSDRISEEYYADVIDSNKDTSRNSISLADAASASARFPWLTPSVVLESSSQKFLLVDGGYSDNSSTKVAREILGVLGYLEENQFRNSAGNECELWIHRGPMEMVNYDEDLETDYAEPNAVDWEGCDLHITINMIVISHAMNGISVSDPDEMENAAQSFTLDPLKAVLKVREASGKTDLLDVREMYCGPGRCVTGMGHFGLPYFTGIYHHMLPIEDLELPLGWKLSRKKIGAISSVSGNPQNCTVFSARSRTKEYQDDETLEYVTKLQSNDKTKFGYVPHENACISALLAAHFEKNRVEQKSPYSIIFTNRENIPNGH